MGSIQLSALALLVVFGANWVLYGCLWLHEKLSHRSSRGESGDRGDAALLPQRAANDATVASAPAAPAAAPSGAGGGGHGKKVLSEPLSRTVSSVRAFSGELSRLGLVITFAYLCEHHPPFPHSNKIHDMDMFWCVALMLLVSSALNVRKSKGGDVLNREQTEEWKGWMQFMFLMYHYFSAHEVYNSIRVFITAYVWMTGFGNFSFFYLKADYGAVRLLQMLWRLNFLVILLCMAMDNHYILYYICPLHTFYFFVVYAIMSPARSANYTKNGMRFKLLAAGAVIFCVWDWDLQIFEKFFFWLSRKSINGAGSGTMWEWYFRTSLDHWSTFLGMIFALNYPATVQWVKKVEAMPPTRQWAIKGSVAVVLLSATAWWADNILPMPKLVYNQKNAYFGVAIPVLTYIYMRNLTPLLRTRYLEPLHSLGKITLETYLMQHHIWLTSNAKTLLVVVPGHAKLNMVVVTVSYVLVSRELYRLTMSLRGMCLPDDLSACLRNLAGIATVLVAAIGAAKVLLVVEAGPAVCGLVIAAIGFGVAFVVHRLLVNKEGAADGLGVSSSNGVAVTGLSGGAAPALGKKEYDGRLLHVNHTVPVLAFVVAVLAGSSAFFHLSVASAEGNSGTYQYSQDVCVETANKGMWKVEAGKCQEPGEAAAYCNSHEWKWVDVPDQCQLHYMPPSEVRDVLKGRHITVVGDSIERFVYYALVRSLGETTPNAHNASAPKHSDFLWTASDGSGTSIDFRWAPLSEDLCNRVTEVYQGDAPDVLIMGGGLWDATYTEGDTEAYAKETIKLREIVTGVSPKNKNSPATLWVSMTNVVTERLVDEKKQTWMTEPNLGAFREVIKSSGILHEVDGVIDGVRLTTGQRRESYDGVHYSDLTYDAFAQVGLNLITHFERTGTIGAASAATDTASGKPRVKKIMGMGSVPLGLIVLFLASVMVLSRDAYHGVARLALMLGGGRHLDAATMTWEGTYGDLLRKIGKHPGGTHGSGSASSGAGGEGLEGARARVRSIVGEEDAEAAKTLLEHGGNGEERGGASAGSSLEIAPTKHVP